MAQIEKIYAVSVPGAELGIDLFLRMGKAIDKVKAAKIALNKEMGIAIANGDLEATEKLRAETEKLEAQIKSLVVQRQAAKSAADQQVKAEAELNKNLVLQSKAEKDRAAAKELNAKADTEKAKADKIRNADLIQQEKELDRLIDRENKLAAAKEKEAKAANSKVAESGSQQDRQNALSELRPFIKTTVDPNATTNFRGEILSLDQAIARFKELSFAEQTFRRQFQQDGTLVGEYSSGILKAFKEGGLDDLIKNQGERIKTELSKLDSEFAQLQQQLSQVGVNADGSFVRLENDLIENRKAAIQLQAEMENVNTSLKGTGGIGEQISEALSENFKDVGKQVAQLAVGFIAFQGIQAGIERTISINFDFQDSANSLKAITGVGATDLEFLKQKALETSDTTKYSAVEIVESFKLIAGAKPELLESVEGLNQVKDASILLAEASGDELPSAVDNLTKVLNQFGAEADEAKSYVDALAAGAKYGAAEVPAITAALLEFGTQAKSSNVSVKESVGLIELLAAKGIQGAEAGTKLRNVLLTLNAANALDKKAQDALKEAGVDMDVLSNNSLTLQQRLQELSKIQNDNTALVKVFGKENFNAGQIVLQNVPSYAKLAEQIGETGVAQTQAADNTKSASTAWAKLKNQFDNFLTSDKVTFILTGIAGALSFFVTNGAVTVTVIASLVTWFAAYRAQLALAAFQEGELNKSSLTYIAIAIAKKIQQAALNALQTTQNLLTSIAISLQLRAAAASGIQAVALQVLGAAFRFLTGPIGIMITLTTALITVVGIFASKAAAAGRSISDFERQQRALNEIQKKSNEASAEQISSIDALRRVVESANSSYGTRREAINDLIKINPAFTAALDGERISVEGLKKAYDEVTKAIRAKADADAAATLTSEAKKNVTQISGLRQQLERQTEIQNSGIISVKGLGESDLDILNKADLVTQKSTFRFSGNGGIVFTPKDLPLIKQELKKQEDDAIKVYQAFLEGRNQADKVLKAIDAKVTEDTQTSTRQRAASNKLTADEIDTLIKGIDDQLKGLKEGDPKIRELTALRASYQTRLDAIYGKEKNSSGAKASRLTGNEKDMFKDIDAARDLAATDLAKQREGGEIGEQTYLSRIFNINKKAIQDKLALLNGSNAEQRKIQADLQLDLITKQNDLNQKLFDQDGKALERQKKQAQDAAKERLEAVETTSGATQTDLAKARIAYDNEILTSEVAFSKSMFLLEDNYKKQSVNNEKERDALIRKERKQLQQDLYALTEAELRDSQNQLAIDISAIKKTYAEMQLANSTSTLPKAKKEQNAKELDKSEARTILSVEIENLKKDLPKLKEELDAGYNVKKEYNDKEEELAEKQRQLHESVTNDLEEKWNKQISIIDNLKKKMQGFISGLAGFKKGDENDQKVGAAVGEIVSQSYALAESAMNGYFDAEKNRIEESKNLLISRLDLEKEQQLARAQSKAEEDSINRQFEAKRIKAEKEAFDKKKEVDKKQARIAFLLEVANIWMSAIQLGPIAGPILGAILTALAGVRYANTISGINSQKYAHGGTVAPTSKGGIADGPSHANGGVPFNYEAEGGEMFIVNKRAAASPARYTVSGTTKQIASAINEIGGGVRFAGGAKAKKYADGGMLGSNVPAPIFIPARNYQNDLSAETSVTMEAITTMANAMAEHGRALQEQSNRIDRIQVVQVTNSVTKAQKKEAKQINLASL